MARERRAEVWTVPGSARRGDDVLFYFTAPVSGFVATGRVQGDLEDAAVIGRTGWMADVGEVVMLPVPVPRADVAAALPEWGWLRNARNRTTVPPELADRLLRSLGLAEPAPAARPEERGRAVEENMRRERRVLARSRNRGLRDEKMERSDGVCEACEADFAALPDGRWRPLLQAHHLRPLSLDDETQVSGLDDLAAVCPTCHRLLHLEPGPEPAPKTVRRRLRDAGLLPTR